MKKRKYIFKTPENRQRCGEAGRRNITPYNMASAKPDNPRNLRHGVSAYISTGAGLPPEIEKQVDEFERGIIEELGNVKASDLALIKSTKIALAILLLGSARLSSLKRFSRNKHLLSILATFMNSLRLNLEVIGGLSHRIKSVEDSLALPRVPDTDARAEAARIVEEFIQQGSKEP